jgi:hypothetical protein
MNEAHEAVSVQDLQDRSIWSEVVATYEAAKRSGAATQTQTKVTGKACLRCCLHALKCKHQLVSSTIAGLFATLP